MAERCKRLTSSNFGRICKCTDRTDKTKLANSYVTQKKIDAPALRHGCKYEHVAVDKYEKLNDIKTSACGTFVSASHPFISSSPDRIVDRNILLEVKCPYASRDRKISNTTVPYLKYENGNLYLDQNHDYFFQIQGQLYCSGRQQCHFCVYTFEDFKVFVVQKDDAFIQSMITKLSVFYDEHFKHAVLDHFYYKKTNRYTFD